MVRPALLLAVAALSIPSAAHAHAKLVAANPAANASVAAAPMHIVLRFSEKLMPTFSGADLTMTGMARSPMTVSSAVAVAPDGRTLVITPRAKLGTGRYAVAWHVVSADTHRVSGVLPFSVK